MTATKNDRFDYCCGEDQTKQVMVPGYKIRPEYLRSPSKTSQNILAGLCTDCRFLGSCVWQHNNKLTCEHFK